MATYTNTVISTALFTALAGTPGATDTIRLLDQSITYLTDLSVTGTLAAILATSGFSGNFDPLPLTADATLVTAQWSGQNWRHQGAITTLILDAARGGRWTHQSGTITNGHVKNGTLYLPGNGTITNGYIGGPASGGAICILDVGGTAPTLLRVGPGGQLYLNRDVGTLTLHGGNAKVDSTTVTPTQVDLWDGTLELGAAGDITTLNGYGGVLDARGLKNSITIATLNGYAPLKILMPRTGGVVLTITTRNDFGGGPTIQYA
jgi:hypothetical protein